MATLVWVVISSLVTAAACGLFVMLTRSRGTPYLELHPEDYPPIQDALPLLAGLTESSVHEGNSAKVFQDGAIFPAMLADIAAAEHTIHLETFVWSKGALETRFVDALSAKARAGVKVRVLIDTLGASKASSAELERLKASGANLSSYCKPRWWNLGRFNHRTHRKLLVVDGRIGYAFGHGIADTWLGKGDDPEHWRDTGVRLEGPVVQLVTVLPDDGDVGGADTLSAATRRHAASVATIVTEGQARAFAEAGFELFEGRTAHDDVATAYRCRSFVCALPVHDGLALEELAAPR